MICRSKALRKATERYLAVLLFAVISLLFSCGSARTGATGNGAVKAAADPNSRKLLIRDEGISQLAYVDLSDPGKNWYVPLPTGRDMQLIGQGRVLVGTGNGYEEREIATGKKVIELTAFPGTVAARRLRNGNTLLTGADWQGKQGIVLVEVDKNGTTQRLINFPQFSYVRLVRETASGTFLITADDTVFEGTPSGTITWLAKLTGREKPHAWQALRLANGQTIVSGGYTANLQLFDGTGKFVSAITGPDSVKPNFFAGFQILGNGNYVVINWQGHGPKFGNSGVQLLEYGQAGQLVWSWKQDASKFSSLHGVIVLDGLNTSLLHTENSSGILAPVKNSP